MNNCVLINIFWLTLFFLMRNLKRQLKILFFVLLKLFCLIQTKVFRSIFQSLKLIIIQCPSCSLQ